MGARVRRHGGVVRAGLREQLPRRREPPPAALATTSDAGLAILLGPVGDIETVGGYMVYKCFVFLTTIGAIWGLLAATKLLRGEEDAGRWQLVLSGGTRATRATAATLAGLAGAVVVLFVGTTAIVVDRGPRPEAGVPVRPTPCCTA